jgi:hypothetical protein
MLVRTTLNIGIWSKKLFYFTNVFLFIMNNENYNYAIETMVLAII